LPALSSRARTLGVLAVAALAFLVLAAALGVDWSEEPAMLLGELMGLLAPLAIVAAAAVILYQAFKRSAGA
jgi:riboflavin transporter FmnP